MLILLLGGGIQMSVTCQNRNKTNKKQLRKKHCRHRKQQFPRPEIMFQTCQTASTSCVGHSISLKRQVERASVTCISTEGTLHVGLAGHSDRFLLYLNYMKSMPTGCYEDTVTEFLAAMCRQVLPGQRWVAGSNGNLSPDKR